LILKVFFIIFALVAWKTAAAFLTDEKQQKLFKKYF
jgi:hypothetical protein